MRAVFAALLLLAPLASAQTATCPVATHAEREQAGYWLTLDERLCSDAASGRHSASARVTQGPPSDNRSTPVAYAQLDHDRRGDRSGAFDVREHVDAWYGAYRLEAYYNSTRDAQGFTRCSLYANLTHPRGSAVLRNTLPACVPQDLLLP